ncbi:hypothetical protein OsJ_04493 [Oryza sativa Japonica Group]|uniref:Uncharacterized protein n=2 Tax=Oryza TaxID=4527 RepID=A3A0S4_ORYSJ|nr:hypothetical protein OsJ_04493 [Oryza sativa Japonica Group]
MAAAVAGGGEDAAAAGARLRERPARGLWLGADCAERGREKGGRSGHPARHRHRRDLEEAIPAILVIFSLYPSKPIEWRGLGGWEGINLITPMGEFSLRNSYQITEQSLREERKRREKPFSPTALVLDRVCRPTAPVLSRVCRGKHSDEY